MSVLKVHASACDSEQMVQEIDSIRSAFVSRLKQAATAAGLPEWGLGAHLARVTKRTPKAVSKWLNCESMPERAAMLDLATALDVRTEWLEYGEEPMKSRLMTPPRTVAAVQQLAEQATQDAAAKVLEMLAKHGKTLNSSAQQRLLQAVEDSLEEASSGTVIHADFSRRPAKGDEIRIAHYDVKSAMGAGQVAPDYPEMFEDVIVSQQHLRELGVTYNDPNHLKMMTGVGQSMEPTIRHLDPLIVDVSIREFVGDGIYAFWWQGHFYTKRLQVADADHFEMISDNPRHKDRLIRMDETYIQCRILLVWNAKKV